MIDPDKAELLHALLNNDKLVVEINKHILEMIDKQKHLPPEIKKMIPALGDIHDEVRLTKQLIAAIPIQVARLVRDNNLRLLSLLAPEYLNSSPDVDNTTQ